MIHWCADETLAVLQTAGMMTAAWRSAAAALLPTAARSLRSLRHLSCKLSGADELRRFAAGRMWVECAECGFESVGVEWTVKPLKGRELVS